MAENKAALIIARIAGENFPNVNEQSLTDIRSELDALFKDGTYVLTQDDKKLLLALQQTVMERNNVTPGMKSAMRYIELDVLLHQEKQFETPPAAKATKQFSRAASPDPRIKELQTLLMNAGESYKKTLSDGGVTPNDGIQGRRTNQAIRDYVAANNLQTTMDGLIKHLKEQQAANNQQQSAQNTELKTLHTKIYNGLKTLGYSDLLGDDASDLDKIASALQKAGKDYDYSMSDASQNTLQDSQSAETYADMINQCIQADTTLKEHLKALGYTVGGSRDGLYNQWMLKSIDHFAETHNFKLNNEEGWRSNLQAAVEATLIEQSESYRNEVKNKFKTRYESKGTDLEDIKTRINHSLTSNTPDMRDPDKKGNEAFQSQLYYQEHLIALEVVEELQQEKLEKSLQENEALVTPAGTSEDNTRELKDNIRKSINNDGWETLVNIAQALEADGHAVEGPLGDALRLHKLQYTDPQANAEEIKKLAEKLQRDDAAGNADGVSIEQNETGAYITQILQNVTDNSLIKAIGGAREGGVNANENLIAALKKADIEIPKDFFPVTAADLMAEKLAEMDLRSLNRIERSLRAHEYQFDDTVNPLIDWIDSRETATTASKILAPIIIQAFANEDEGTVHRPALMALLQKEGLEIPDSAKPHIVEYQKTLAPEQDPAPTPTESGPAQKDLSLAQLGDGDLFNVGAILAAHGYESTGAAGEAVNPKGREMAQGNNLTAVWQGILHSFDNVSREDFLAGVAPALTRAFQDERDGNHHPELMKKLLAKGLNIPESAQEHLRQEQAAKDVNAAAAPEKTNAETNARQTAITEISAALGTQDFKNALTSELALGSMMSLARILEKHGYDVGGQTGNVAEWKNLRDASQDLETEIKDIAKRHQQGKTVSSMDELSNYLGQAWTGVQKSWIENSPGFTFAETSDQKINAGQMVDDLTPAIREALEDLKETPDPELENALNMYIYSAMRNYTPPEQANDTGSSAPVGAKP